MGLPEKYASCAPIKPGINRYLTPWEKVGRYARKGTAAALASTCLAGGAGIAFEQLQGEQHEGVEFYGSKEQCRNRLFYAVYLSGTGLQTAFYEARKNDEEVKKYDACSLFVTYGTRYSPDSIADRLVENLESVVDDDREAKVLFIGNSFGGIAAEHIASSFRTRLSRVRISGIVFDSTPGSAACVKEPARALVDAATPRFSLGKAAVYLNNQAGLWQRGQVFNLQQQQYALENAAATDSRLVAQQTSIIRQGFPDPLPEASAVTPPRVWYRYVAGDRVQDPICSMRVIGQKYAKVGVTLVPLAVAPSHETGDPQHAGAWYDSEQRYLPSTTQVLSAIAIQLHGPKNLGGEGRVIKEPTKKP